MTGDDLDRIYAECGSDFPYHDVSPGQGQTAVGLWNSADQTLLGGCQVSDVWQSLVAFDLGPLEQYPGIDIQSAELQFGEDMRQQDNELHATCVGNVDIAGSDHAAPNGLYQWLDELPLFRLQSSGHWDALKAVQLWRSEAQMNYGLVLRGPNEDFAFNNAMCTSIISDPKLVVRFTWDKPQLSDLDVVLMDIADKSGPSECVTGQIDVVAAVENIGDIDAPPFDLVLRVNGENSETISIDFDVAGGARTVSFGTVSLLQGPNKVEVVADPANAVAESSEDNNLISRLVACAQSGPKVDLPVTQTQQGSKVADIIKTIPDKSVELQLASVKFLPGQGKDNCSASTPHQVMAVVKNSGTETLGSVVLQLLVDDQPRATITATGIGPQVPVNAYFENATLSKGSHKLVVVVDPDNKVSEANEGNNRSSPIQVSCK